MPAALKAHLMDEALRHRRSINEEVLARLMPSGERRRAMRRELMALEPTPNDPRTDAEILSQMDRVYERWGAPVVGDRPVPEAEAEMTDSRVEETMGGVGWLNPGGWPKVSS